MIRGWVYILTNKAMLGLVKIGYSSKDPSLRAEELNGTGLPYPFEVVYDVLVEDPRDVEQEVHFYLKDCHESKEFFRVDIDEAISAINAVVSKQEKSVFMETKGNVPVGIAHIKLSRLFKVKVATGGLTVEGYGPEAFLDMHIGLFLPPHPTHFLIKAGIDTLRKMLKYSETEIIRKTTGAEFNPTASLCDLEDFEPTGLFLLHSKGSEPS